MRTSYLEAPKGKGSPPVLVHPRGLNDRRPDIDCGCQRMCLVPSSLGCSLFITHCWLLLGVYLYHLLLIYLSAFFSAIKSSADDGALNFKFFILSPPGYWCRTLLGFTAWFTVGCPFICIQKKENASCVQKYVM